MPIRVGNSSNWQKIKPNQTWQELPTTLTKETFAVATNLYYVNIQSK